MPILLKSQGLILISPDCIKHLLPINFFGHSVLQCYTYSSFLENVLPAERMAIEDQTNKILNKMTEDEKQQEAERIFKNMGKF